MPEKWSVLRAAIAANETALQTLWRWRWWLIPPFALAYVLQVFTPLRLNTDVIRLLGMALSAHGGHGLRGWGEDQLPPGYPLVVLGLHQLGLATSATFVALNLLGLFGGAWAWLRVNERSAGLGRRGAMLCSVLALLSWVAVKHVTLPVTDTVYFGVSSLALLMISQAHISSPRDRSRYHVSAAALVAAAIAVRTVGVVLLPALGWSVLGGTQGLTAAGRRLAARRGMAIVGGAVAVVTVAAGAHAITGTAYFGALLEKYADASPLQGLATALTSRVFDAGEVAINLPISRFAAFGWIFGAVGCVLLTAVLADLARRRGRLPARLHGRAARVAVQRCPLFPSGASAALGRVRSTGETRASRGDDAGTRGATVVRHHGGRRVGL
jgi:hypothetical protein